MHLVLLNRKALTFYNINDAEAKQRWYMIGCGRVNCNSSTHAVTNYHDWRRVVSIEHLHYFANIPFIKGEKGKKNSLFWNISVTLPLLYNQKLLTVLQSSKICTMQCVCTACLNCIQQLTWPSCLLRDHQGFSLWSHLQIRKERHILEFCSAYW